MFVGRWLCMVANTPSPMSLMHTSPIISPISWNTGERIGLPSLSPKYVSAYQVSRTSNTFKTIKWLNLSCIVERFLQQSCNLDALCFAHSANFKGLVCFLFHFFTSHSKQSKVCSAFLKTIKYEAKLQWPSLSIRSNISCSVLRSWFCFSLHPLLSHDAGLLLCFLIYMLLPYLNHLFSWSLICSSSRIASYSSLRACNSSLVISMIFKPSCL